jgi:hypothetical protein
MKCERCDGEGEREVNDPEAGDVMVVCTDCKGSGRKYEDCGQCGERFEYETGSGDVCADCIEKARPRRHEDDDWKRKYDRE